MFCVLAGLSHRLCEAMRENRKEPARALPNTRAIGPQPLQSPRTNLTRQTKVSGTRQPMVAIGMPRAAAVRVGIDARQVAWLFVVVQLFKLLLGMRMRAVPDLCT